MEVQGYVVIGLTLILLGYLLPHLVRSRQIQIDSRVGDRFSADLRILATAGTGVAVMASATGGGVHHGGPASRRPFLHDPHRRPEAPAVNRPQTRGDGAPQEARALAAARAARAARVSRRTAAARRRLILTVALLVLTVASVAGGALALTHWAVVAIPTTLLATVLVLGRRTAIKARANDRRDRARIAELEARVAAATNRTTPVTARPRVARSARSADTATAAAAPASLSARVPSAGAGASAVADASAGGEDDLEAPAATETVTAPHAGAGDGEAPDAGAEETIVATLAQAGGDDAAAPPAASAEDDVTAEDSGATTADLVVPAVTELDAELSAGWTPVPVPVPSYTLKPSAPRRDVAAYADEEAAPSAAVPQRPTAPSPAAAAVSLGEPVAPALDLDRVLARRRAAGE